MKTIMNKVCLLAVSLSCLVSSPLVIAQSNSAAALVPVIYLLLLDEEQERDPCVVLIRLGSVVFDTLDPECPPQERANSFGKYFSFFHPGGPLHIDLISDSPNSFESALSIREGGRTGDRITALEEDGSANGFNQGSHDHSLNSRLRYSSLPSGVYTIEAASIAPTADDAIEGAFNLSVYGSIVTARATGRLNDTGIAGSVLGLREFVSNSCSPIHPLQDCHFGRDSDELIGRDDTGSDGDGQDGFSFLKVSASGEPLPANTEILHACVKDNVTGLMWEVKTDGGRHDAAHTYTWYNSNSNENGGASGALGDNTTCSLSNCNTESYVTEVNSAGLCGYTDWRMPTVTELQGLLNYNNVGNGNTLENEFFLIPANGDFWSASPFASNNDGAWGVDFDDGFVGSHGRSSGRRVRLVRGGSAQ